MAAWPALRRSVHTPHTPCTPSSLSSPVFRICVTLRIVSLQMWQSPLVCFQWVNLIWMTRFLLVFQGLKRFPISPSTKPPLLALKQVIVGSLGRRGEGEEREHSCLVGKCHSYIIGCCTLTQLCCTVAFAQSDLVAQWQVCCTQLHNEYCVVSLCFTAFLSLNLMHSLQKFTPTLRQARRAERRRGEEISSWFLPPLEKRLQKKVFESKCHWLAITDWDAGGVVHVNLLRLLFQCDQSRNRNIECVRQFTSNICPYQLMIVTTQTYLKRWQCADWSRQELEKEQTRRGEERRGREFHRSCRHCYSCTSAAAAATCRDIWRIGWHLDHSLLPPPPPPPPSPSKKTQEPAPRTFLTTPRVSNFHFAQAPFPFRFLRARVPFSCKWKLHFELTAAAAAALDGA